MDWDAVIFNICAFFAGLFLLTYGADLFIDHTAIVARRLGISETLIALLTAGAEWEELAVVIASIFQNHPTIGYSNIIGSSISNILGAFSLGLLFAGPGPIVFDRSAKIYSGALFLITSVYVLTSLTGHLNLTGGIFFMVAFGVYLFSVGSAIYDGILRAPKGEANGDAGSHNNVANGRDEEILQQNGNSSLSTNPPYTVTIYPTVTHCPPNETSPLLQNGTLPTEHHAPPNTTTTTTSASHPPTKPLHYHFLALLLGFLALSISGFILSHTSTKLASLLSLSNTTVGLTILSLSTTLPEKFLAILSGSRHHAGILVATTAGCNIFLLTLCLGVLFVSQGGGDGDAGEKKGLVDSLLPFEIWTTWLSALLLLLVVWIGGRRWVGVLLLACYAAFWGCEFTVFRR